MPEELEELSDQIAFKRLALCPHHSLELIPEFIGNYFHVRCPITHCPVEYDISEYGGFSVQVVQTP